MPGLLLQSLVESMGKTIRFKFRNVSFLFFMAMALTVAINGCVDANTTRTSSSKKEVKKLNILTPNNTEIQNAFEYGFRIWYRDNYKKEVSINWIYLGTPQCLKYVEDSSVKRKEQAPRVIPDILFGGGYQEHHIISQNDWARPLNIEDVIKTIPAYVGSFNTRSPKKDWVAMGLTSFGILYNHRDCSMRGILPPAEFEDLADPRFAGWISLAEPSKSGSNRQSMMLLTHKHGWNKGWEYIMKILANSRGLAGRSTTALKQVESGYALAAFAVNFDALSITSKNKGRLAFAPAKNSTTISPDLVSILKTCKDPVLAERFVRFVLSEDGQALWALRSSEILTDSDTLFHYPILPSIYEDRAEDLAVKINPLKNPFGQEIDSTLSQKQNEIIGPLVEAATSGENHIKLQTLWQKLIDKNMPAEASAELFKPVFSEEEAYQKGLEFKNASRFETPQIMQQWIKLYADKYKKVEEMLGS